MGEEVDQQEFSREDRTRYREKVRRCLDVFARMLRESAFDADYPMTGLEIELCNAYSSCSTHLSSGDVNRTGITRMIVTPRVWAYEHAGIAPDIMTLAKALANGIPIGAMLCREEVAAALTPGTHGSTFGGTPFVTSVALATLTTVLADKLPEHAARMGDVLMDGLRGLQRELSTVRQVRGRGLLIGVELSHPVGPVVDGCRERGLLLLNCGPYDNVVRFIPPLIVDEHQVRQAVGIFEEALQS